MQDWRQQQPAPGRSGGNLSAMWQNLILRFGSVTQLIIWVCIGVFLAQLFCQFLGFPIVDYLFALRSMQVLQGMVWQLATYMFLHGGLWHILINLLILWFIGREVEYFIGPKYYTRLFLLGGLFGGILWLVFNLGSATPVVGASAGVLACVIAFATLFPDRELTFLLWFILPVRIKARYLALILVAFDVVPLLQGAQTNIAHLAHLGGAALGYLYIKHLGYGRVPRWLQAVLAIGRPLKSRPRARSSATRTSTSSGAWGGSRKVRRPHLSPEAYIQEQVDPILEKISREGMQSLTPSERRILESAQDLLKKRQR